MKAESRNNSKTPAAQNVSAAAVVAEADKFFSDDSARSTENGQSPIKKLFPVLSEKAFYGQAGQIVKIIEPHTEADSAALLIQSLAAYGNVIGKGSFFQVGADRHYMKLFAVLVGATARGRKGTSWGEVSRIFSRADESFIDCVQNGLSSGEGLIYHVRDAQTKQTPIKRNGKIEGYQDEVIDAGAKEKRLCVIEPEFARVLKVIKREGNTLSPAIRQAWDNDRLTIMTKNAVKASDAHISIVGHITDAELIRNLEETETANGFANRFLWLCVKRSKYLPDGGNLKESDLNEVISQLRMAINFGAQDRQITRDAEANRLWHKIYRKLSDGYGGLLGSVTSRATAQVMRLASIYALLDFSEVVKVQHLDAALALYQYCEDSAKYVFGMTTGDKLADDIISALESSEHGMSRTELNNYFNRNRTSGEMDSALETLLELQRIEKIQEPTGGRPREIFKVASYELNELSTASQI